MCEKGDAFISVFYETGKIRDQKKKMGWKKQVLPYTFLKRKIRSVLPTRADLLPERKSLLKERICVWNKVMHLLAFCCTASI